MPMIDVHATEGTFSDKHTLAQDLAKAVMRWEQVPEIPLFLDNTAAFIHDLPAGAISNAAGDSNYVRVQVLTPINVLDRDTQVLGASVDSEFVHFQWRAQHDDLKKLPFPMLSDLKRELVEATGALNNEGVADRVTYIVDPNNEIQFVSVTAGSVGRNVDEVLRVLDALQSDELCACNWRKGDPTLDAGELLKASA